MVLALAVGALAYGLNQRKRRMKLKNSKQEPLLSSQTNDPEMGISMGPSYPVAPVKGALTHSRTHTHTLTHLLTHSLTYLLTH